MALPNESVEQECQAEPLNNIDRITRSISLKGDLSEDQKQSLMAIADKCPAHRTLENDPQIVTELVQVKDYLVNYTRGS